MSDTTRKTLKDISGNTVVISADNIVPSEIDLSSFKNDSADKFAKQSELTGKQDKITSILNLTSSQNDCSLTFNGTNAISYTSSQGVKVGNTSFGLKLYGWAVRPSYVDKDSTTSSLALLSDVPSVGNGTITINQGGTLKGTFTVNQAGNTTIDLDAGGSGTSDFNSLTNRPKYNGTAMTGDTNIPSVPTTYLKTASVNGNTLTITKQDDTSISFTPTSGSALIGIKDGDNSSVLVGSYISAGSMVHKVTSFAGQDIASKKSKGVNNFVFGREGTVEGVACLGFGNKVFATGVGCISVGGGTIAGQTINWSDITGGSLTSSDRFCFATGDTTKATGYATAAFGNGCEASGEKTFAQGHYTKSSGASSHSEGNMTEATGTASHSEGNSTKATGNYSHSEGDQTQSIGSYSHSEGYRNIVNGNTSHAEGGNNTIITSKAVPVPPQPTYKLSGQWKFKDQCTAPSSDVSWNKTGLSYTANSTSFARIIVEKVGAWWRIRFLNSDASVSINITSGAFSPDYTAYQTITFTQTADFEDNIDLYNWIKANATQIVPETDWDAIAGQQAHAEGVSNEVLGYSSHAEGTGNHAYAPFSHVEGLYSTAGKLKVDPNDTTKYIYDSGKGASASGYSCVAQGNYSRAIGISTIAGYDGQLALGKYNLNKNTDLLEIGCGSSSERKNAVEINNNGTVSFRYLTTAPTSDNTSGLLAFVVLDTEPTTKYNGYVYLITE